MKTVFTIGHSTHSIDVFLDLIKKHEVTAICDVRSSPYSRISPQYNCETLSRLLKGVNIAYVFLGKELGARSEDRCCYVDGKVQYELLAKTPLFKKGLERVLEGAARFRVALMCSEKEPLDCHRTILVARRLTEAGLAVNHIMGDGAVQSHESIINKLRGKLNLMTDLLLTETELSQEAYRIQGNKIAYEDRDKQLPNVA